MRSAAEAIRPLRIAAPQHNRSVGQSPRLRVRDPQDVALVASIARDVQTHRIRERPDDGEVRVRRALGDGDAGCR